MFFKNFWQLTTVSPILLSFCSAIKHCCKIFSIIIIIWKAKLSKNLYSLCNFTRWYKWLDKWPSNKFISYWNLAAREECLNKSTPPPNSITFLKIQEFYCHFTRQYNTILWSSIYITPLNKRDHSWCSSALWMTLSIPGQCSWQTTPGCSTSMTFNKASIGHQQLFGEGVIFQDPQEVESLLCLLDLGWC